MEVKNYGRIRGGSNSYARFFLHIRSELDGKKEEMDAIFSLWDEEFGLKGYNWCGRCYEINNRREFAVVPAMIRKAQKLGYELSTSMWDEGPKDEVSLSQDPALFWQVLALAQAFFNE